MTIGIYKITNNINGKSYVGQSVHIERRWQEHQRSSSTSLISKAIKKYGIDNFTFEIIEICKKEQLDIKEQYWMAYYNTITPKGYNVSDITESQHSQFSHFTKDDLHNIIHDIKKTTMTLSEIANKYNLNVSTISRINSGEIHYQQNEKYPLRLIQDNKIKSNFCQDCGIRISNKAIRCNKCEGNHRKINNFNNLPVSREKLKVLIRNTPFIQIGKMCNVSDNAIRKWCLKLNLPSKSKDIKKISDEEWKLI